MLKLLTISTLLTSSVFASIDGDILRYEKHRVSANPNIELQNIDIGYKKKLSKDWWGYSFDIKISVPSKDGKKTVDVKDIIFTDGKVVATELRDIKTNMSLKDIMVPELTDIYYNKKHLIAGNHNAKHKMVVFSDPLCPFCIENLPAVVEAIKKSSNMAMYYYDFPLLSIHPAADTITRYMVLAKEKNISDVVYKIYTSKLEEKFDVRVNDPEIIVPALNKIYGLNLTVQEVMSEYTKTQVQKDIKMGDDVMVRGTPTIFFDGKYDPSREKFKRFIQYK
jgi:predicted DsbA family dithiol-disulfide isomerase